MSLIRRRKSPGWKKISVKSNIRRIPKAASRSNGRLKIIKILNPISRKKINLNGPTHKRLIREKILNVSGVDIRSRTKKIKPKTKPKIKPKIRTKPKPKFQPKTKPKIKPKPSRLYGDVMGNIMMFLPEKEMVKISKLKRKYPKRNLLDYPFDFSNPGMCQAFADSDFEVLMKNQNLNRLGLFECVVKRGLLDKVKILLKDKNIDSSNRNSAFHWASRNGRLETVVELLKDLQVDPSANDDEAIREASAWGHLEIVKLLLKDERVDPSANNNDAILLASSYGNPEIVKELLKDSRVVSLAINMMNRLNNWER